MTEGRIPAEVARTVLEQNLGLRAKERLVVVADTETQGIGLSLWEAGTRLGAEATLALIEPTGRNGAEPPAPAAAAMAQCDVLLCPTRYSLSHTQARLRATNAGARVATMPGIQPRMFEDGPIAAEPKALQERTERIRRALSRASRARIVTEGRVELAFSVAGREGRMSTGHLLTPGAFGNLPSGEAYLAPVEGTAEGELVVNASAAGIGLIEAPLRLTIRQGLLEAAEGPAGRLLLDLLGEAPEARNVAEFGVGSNDCARITGVILEDEKRLGTIHIAFGDNSTFGGKVQAGVHIDTVIKDPTVYLDDTVVLDAGHLLI